MCLRPRALNSLPRRAMSERLSEALRDGPKGGVALAAYVAEHQPAVSDKAAQGGHSGRSAATSRSEVPRRPDTVGRPLDAFDFGQLLVTDVSAKGCEMPAGHDPACDNRMTSPACCEGE